MNLSFFQQKKINEMRHRAAPFAENDTIVKLPYNDIEEFVQQSEAWELQRTGAINYYNGYFYIFAPQKELVYPVEPVVSRAYETETVKNARLKYREARRYTEAARDDLRQSALLSTKTDSGASIATATQDYYGCCEREAFAARALADLVNGDDIPF